MRLLTKMSATGLGHDMASIKAVFAGENPPARFFVGRIFGIANGVKEYVDKNNGEVRFGLKGEFGGISSLKDTHDVADARSKMCYLPEVAQQDVISKIADVDPETGKPSVKRSIEFAFDIYAVNRPSSSVGYVFDVDQLITVTENDPLANMFDKIEKSLPLALAGVQGVEALTHEGEATGEVIDAETVTVDAVETPAPKGKK